MGENYGTLHQVLQLTYVARPRVGREGRHGFRRNVLDMPSHAAAENLGKMLHQRWNIFPAFAEGRQHDGENIQPVIQVTAEFIPCGHFQQVSIRCAHQPHVHLMGAPATQALELL
ncbi:MAG TPA: hypothetical protein VMB49_09935, partial [Acidobacteriaceae bacterium]|nr:hypothetical protein [Acidobacteriaceae bacterium]